MPLLSEAAVAEEGAGGDAVEAAAPPATAGRDVLLLRRPILGEAAEVAQRHLPFRAFVRAMAPSPRSGSLMPVCSKHLL